MLSTKEITKELLLFGFEKLATTRTSGSHIRFCYRKCYLLEIGITDHKDVSNMSTGLYGEVVDTLVMLAYYYTVDNGTVNKQKAKEYFKGHDKGLVQDIVSKLKKMLKEDIQWAKMITPAVYKKIEYKYGDVDNNTIEKYFKNGRNVD